jgi:DNA-binding phage protein
MADETTILSLEEICRRLRNYNISAVARETGISKQGIYQIIRGGSTPMYSTVAKLSDFLRQN